MSDVSAREPFRFAIPILLILFVPLMHLTATGVTMLETGWVLVGLGGAVFAVFMIFSGVSVGSDGVRDPLATSAWLLLIGYLFHQFEEHGIDLYGRVYYFIEYGNVQLAARFGESGPQLTDLAIYRINTLGIWVPFLLAIWAGRRLPWVGLAAAGTMLTNGLFHIMIAVGNGEYNPGLGTALVLFLPISISYFRNARREAGIGLLAVLGGIAFGVAGHVLLPTMIVAAGVADWSPQLSAMFGLLVLGPLVANIIYRLFRRS
jgi:hypothetical protein